MVRWQTVSPFDWEFGGLNVELVGYSPSRKPPTVRTCYAFTTMLDSGLKCPDHQAELQFCFTLWNKSEMWAVIQKLGTLKVRSCVELLWHYDLSP